MEDKNKGLNSANFFGQQYMNMWMDLPIFKDMVANQQTLYEQLKKVAKTTEEMNIKTFESMKDNFIICSKNTFFHKYQDLFKDTENNYKKLFSFVEQNSKDLGNKEFLTKQIQNFEKNMNLYNQSFLEYLDKNHQLFNESVVQSMLDQNDKHMKEVLEKVYKYNEEQLKFFMNFQANLIEVMNGKNPSVEVPNTIMKFSKELLDNNTKQIEENVKNFAKTVTQPKEK